MAMPALAPPDRPFDDDDDDDEDDDGLDVEELELDGFPPNGQ